MIVVTNPLDEMTYLAAEASGLPEGARDGDGRRARLGPAAVLHRRGAGGLADRVEAITLGSHGESMVPLPRHATVDGKPLPELVDEATLERSVQRTRDGGAEIVGLLKKGSAYYAPSASVAQMVEAIAERREASAARLRLVHRRSTGSRTSTWACRRGSVARASRRSSSWTSTRTSRRRCATAAEGIRAKCADLAKL